jgi:hypothetical protein
MRAFPTLDRQGRNNNAPKELVDISSEPVRRRRCTPVVVRPPNTVPITPEDYKLAVDTIARMIAQWWDAHGRQLPRY